MLTLFGTSTKRYSDFIAANMSRTAMVYAGSNDGMLHGFNADNNGSEELAFIPSTLFSSGIGPAGLHHLTDPGYVHSYYVDLSATVGDAFINTSPSAGIGSPDWTTVLIGGLRAGGKGVFALDITDPSAFSNTTAAAQNTVLWEFDDSDSAFMGFSYSQPRIALLNNGEWAILFGNGYNSTDGDAALVILYLEEGIDGTWSTGDFEIIETNSGDSANVNGMGQITLVDLNSDQVIDRVYGGDIRGNLWAFDLSSSNTSSWDVAYRSGGNPVPLFTAEDANPGSTPSPVETAITVRAAITRTEVSNSDNLPNILVFFGSGQYLTDADPTDTQQQAFYGVWDAGVSRLDRGDLVEQTISNPTNGGVADADFRLLSQNSVNYPVNPTSSSNQMGWYIELPTAGERVVVDPVVRLGQVFFLTLIPDAAACSDGGGSGFLMIADAATGGAPTIGVLDINNDGTIDSGDQLDGNYVQGQFVEGIPTGQGFLGGSNNVFITTTKGSGADSIISPGINEIDGGGARRLSWQELIE